MVSFQGCKKICESCKKASELANINANLQKNEIVAKYMKSSKIPLYEESDLHTNT